MTGPLRKERMKHAALWLVFWLAMAQTVMAQGEVAAVQTPSVTAPTTLSSASVSPPASESPEPMVVQRSADWEQSMNAFIDDTLPRVWVWMNARLRQNPLLFIPLVFCGMMSTYFSAVLLGAVSGTLRRWRADVRLAAEKSLTRAERQKHLRGIMKDVVKHLQSKLQYETGYYSVGQPPPSRPTMPRPIDTPRPSDLS